MNRQRVPETESGIQGVESVEIYDAFAKNMRDRGYLPVKEYIAKGLSGGKALEIGPGPGYVGLEWLRACSGSSLIGLEISLDMIKIAERNAREYDLQDRARYVKGNSMQMPFENDCFDCAFSNGSLHEWQEPALAFAEILRVLKPGGVFCVTDLRRNIGLLVKSFALANARPKGIRSGFMSSLNASYTKPELDEIISDAHIKATVEENFMDLSISGLKE
jgi:ubiquinone/menaquinone biosynthesis C-methylase UbiE